MGGRAGEGGWGGGALIAQNDVYSLTPVDTKDILGPPKSIVSVIISVLLERVAIQNINGVKVNV